MSAQKRKGTAFETVVARGFSEALGIPVDRVVLHGRDDEGDVHVPTGRGVLVVEAKNRQKMSLAEWVDEAHAEAAHCDRKRTTLAGVVIHKRRGKGKFLDQYVTMTVADLLTILGEK